MNEIPIEQIDTNEVLLHNNGSSNVLISGKRIHTVGDRIWVRSKQQEFEFSQDPNSNEDHGHLVVCVHHSSDSEDSTPAFAIRKGFGGFVVGPGFYSILQVDEDPFVSISGHGSSSSFL